MKLLVIVDYQNDFVTGSLGFPKARTLEEKIYNKALEYHNSKNEIVFTLDTHQDDYLLTEEGRHLPIKHAIINTEGHKLYGKIATLPGQRFYKPTFGSQDFFNFLKNTPFQQIELVGVVTNMCVIANAILAKTAQPEAEIIIDASCCASFDDTLHEKALDIMEGLQMKVINRGDK